MFSYLGETSPEENPFQTNELRPPRPFPVIGQSEGRIQNMEHRSIDYFCRLHGKQFLENCHNVVPRAFSIDSEAGKTRQKNALKERVVFVQIVNDAAAILKLFTCIPYGLDPLRV